jgi:HK97 gp10 family phage protein
MSVKVKIEGLKEVKAALRELPDATAKRIMRRVLIDAGQMIAETARQLAPVAGGDLRDSIAVGTTLSKSQRKKHRKGGKDDVEVFVGPAVPDGGNSPVPQAILQEFGTSHHPAQPFLRPAWDQHKRAVLDGIKDAMWTKIRKAAERLAKKAAKTAAKLKG